MLKLNYSNVQFQNISLGETDPASRTGKTEERTRGQKGNGEGDGKDRGRGGKKNGDLPPTSFGLKVELLESISSVRSYVT